jgi:hypothetical protein
MEARLCCISGRYGIVKGHRRNPILAMRRVEPRGGVEAKAGVIASVESVVALASTIDAPVALG